MRSVKQMILIIAITLLIVLSGCQNNIEKKENNNLTNETIKLNIANPASTKCVKTGGKVEIVTDEQGNQRGNCILPNGHVCDEWEYFHDACK